MPLDLSAAPGAPQFLTDLVSGEPERHLRVLYGPSWRQSFARNGQSLRSRRLPGPGALAPFLAPALEGLVAHDGSPRSGIDRWHGWWISDGPSWRRAPRSDISVALAELAEEMYTEARAAYVCRRELHGRTGECICAPCALPAAVEAIGAIARSGHRHVGPLLLELQGAPGFQLPTSAHDADLRTWVAETADLEAWPALVPMADMWSAYERDEGPLGKHAFFRRLDAILGRRDASRRYALPAATIPEEHRV